jgi:2-polyprenyl-3-methyl-5-hydroxy-6-metoxy-1,4-benzoquinol methylase
MSIVDAVSWEEAVRQLKADERNELLVRACFYDDPLLQAAERFFGGTEWVASRRWTGSARGAALDVGAGRGIASYALARDGWAVTALEPDPSALVGAGAIRALANDAGLSIDVVQTWGEQLPFGDERFALVYCRQVLHHANDLQQLCREIARVLRPGGVMLAAREHVISKQSDLQAFLDGHPLHRLYGGEHAYQSHEYEDAIRGAGLVVEQVINPYASDINLYPLTVADMKRQWAQRLHWPAASAFIPDAAVAWAGSRTTAPGRLFTFVARKPGGRAS